MNIIFVIFSFLSICECLEEFSEFIDSSEDVDINLNPTQVPQGSIPPIIVPTIRTPTSDSQTHNPCYNYCNYYPSYYCSINCVQTPGFPTPDQDKVIYIPTTVTERIPKIVTNNVPKEIVTKTVEMEITSTVVCPINFHMIKDPDNGERCVSNDLKVQCASPFEWIKERCVATTIICPNEYSTEKNQCTPRIICPQNYILQGSVCIAPTPTCPIGWRWNGHNCQVERATCPAGYTLRDDKCIYETYRCPPNFKEFGNRCVKEDPVCPLGYTINVSDHTCVKHVTRCPNGSSQQNGLCIKITHECPTGATETGDSCTVVVTTYEIKHKIKYKKKVVKVPGRPFCGSTTNYNCVNPCVVPSGCINPCITGNTNCVNPCLPNNDCIPTSG